MKQFSDELLCLDPTNLKTQLSQFGKNTAVTHGEYIVSSVGTADDHAWNHMDQDHRPFIHRTYTEALRLARGKNFAVSLTKFKVGPFKFSMLITDVHVSKNLCYQGYSIFNLIYVHNLTHNVDNKIHIEWYLVSHPFFKFLHTALHWRLKRLNRVQIAEDVQIIKRRKELREKGYTFSTDNPDYINSNEPANGVHAPVTPSEVSLSLSSLTENNRKKFSQNNIELLIEKCGDELKVWPAICPHQGASLETSKVCGKKIECSWHGFKFSPVTLSRKQPSGILSGVQLEWQSDSLLVRTNENQTKKTTPCRLAAPQQST